MLVRIVCVYNGTERTGPGTWLWSVAGKWLLEELPCICVLMSHHDISADVITGHVYGVL